MKCSFLAVLALLTGAGLACATEPNGHRTLTASADAGQPVQDDEPRADIVSGQFIIIRTSQTLDCDAGLAWIGRLAEAGDSEAMFELGDLYESGNCTPADKAKALMWFEKAAASGSTAALGSLGRAYYAGGGADAPDYAKALLWLSRGATRLDTRSFYFLGLMFQQGKGVRPDNAHAFVLLDVSAHLFAPFTDERAVAIAARDRAREGLTPMEVARAGSTSRRLLKAMLEHRKQTIDDLFPQEALAVLHASR